jgi:hypothetical protein
MLACGSKTRNSLDCAAGIADSRTRWSAPRRTAEHRVRRDEPRRDSDFEIDGDSITKRNTLGGLEKLEHLSHREPGDRNCAAANLGVGIVHQAPRLRHDRRHAPGRPFNAAFAASSSASISLRATDGD